MFRFKLEMGRGCLPTAPKHGLKQATTAWRMVHSTGAKQVGSACLKDALNTAKSSSDILFFCRVLRCQYQTSTDASGRRLYGVHQGRIHSSHTASSFHVQGDQLLSGKYRQSEKLDSFLDTTHRSILLQYQSLLRVARYAQRL